VINCNDKKTNSVSNGFLCEQEKVPAVEAESAKPQPYPSQEDIAQNATWRNLCGTTTKMPLHQHDLDQAKARLRHTIEVSLQQDYALPVLADILTDYLLEVVQEDDQKCGLFRVQD